VVAAIHQHHLMGIQGLHDFMKNDLNVLVDDNISSFAGKRVGVDTLGWLHAAKHSIPLEPFDDVPLDKYAKYCIDKVKQLQEAGITPVMVFDGANLPAKACLEVERAAKREGDRREGLEYLKQNKRKEADKCFKKALDICPVIVQKLIRELKAMRIEIIVAPYEADAQVKEKKRRKAMAPRHFWTVASPPFCLKTNACMTQAYYCERKMIL
jgi:exonuclease-1